MAIGEKIKALRKQNDLTQEKLADLLNISYQAVSKWETGVSSPDISLIAPLTRLLHVSADELLGLSEAESDMRLNELENAYKSAKNSENMRECCRISQSAVNEYPDNMMWMDRLAWAEAMGSFDFADNEQYAAEQEKAIKHFSLVIENCTDEKIKCSSIQGIVQYLSFRGRRDEARKYAELYPDWSGILARDAVIESCLWGEERVIHRQNMLNTRIQKLLNQLTSTGLKLESYIACDRIIELLIPDRNYLGYNDFLFISSVMQAICHANSGRCDDATAALTKVKGYAIAMDSIPEGKQKYTAPLLDKVEFDRSELVASDTKLIDSFKWWTASKSFDCLRERSDFIALTE